MRTKTIFSLAVVAFILLAVFLPRGFISPDFGNTILTISTFLFGLLAGFYIVVTITDYNSIKDILANETGEWISLFHNVVIYDEPLARTLSRLIDEYIRRAFDYELIDYTEGTGKEFGKVVKFLRALPIKTDRSSVYEAILENIRGIFQTRQKLTVLGTKTLSLFQWFVLFILAAFVIISLYGLRTGEFFFEIIAVFIPSAIVLTLLIIRDLDLYIWNEKTFGFQIFQNVLKAIGQLPYYPLESIKAKRVEPTEKEYRVGVFVNFPKSLERKIEIRKTGN